MFLSEMWLHDGELDLIENKFPNHYVLFQGDMAISDSYTKPGRPFGGKC